MKRVMFMTNSLSGGGAEKILQTLINNLDRKKYDITLYSLHYEPDFLSLYPSDINYKYVFGFKKTSFLIDCLKSFLNKVKGKIFMTIPPFLFYFLYIKGKYDVEIAFIEGESTKIISGSNNRHSKKYAWVHIDLINNPWTDITYKSLEEEKNCYRKYNRVLCVSSSVKNAFDSKYNTGNSAIQYNPVDEKEILNKSKELIVHKQANLQFVTLGRLVPQKGYDRLLKCIKKIRDDGFDDFNIWILGEGEQRKLLEKYIEDNSLKKYVTLLGFKSNPYPYIAESDAFICSSRSEGFSTVATESLILGKPIFTVDCAGMKELFGGYKCGIIVNNSEDDLYKMLLSILNNNHKISQYNFDIANRQKSFTLERRIMEIEDLINE